MAHTPPEDLTRDEQLLFRTLASNVKTYIAAEGISVRQFAARVARCRNDESPPPGVYKTVIRVTEGKGVHLSVLAQLARAMGCTWSDLLKR